VHSVRTSTEPPEPFLVEQPAFQGTLGELTWALRNGSVEAGAIDLLGLVKSYLGYFEEFSALNLELASQALPGVAQVIELKLRLLLPRPPREDSEESQEVFEETLEAVSMLEELEDAIDFLRQRRRERRLMLPAHTPRPPYPRKSRPLNTGPKELARLASRYRTGSYFEMATPRLTVSGAMKNLLDRLRSWGRRKLHEAAGGREWGELSVYFVGMLELVRSGDVRASQEEPFGEIELELTPGRNGKAAPPEEKPAPVEA